MAPRLVAPERQPFPALPEGWSVIGRCRFGTGGPGPSATGCYALANPGVGVALIDVAPDATPNAEARLRRALTAAEFWPDFPGTLPVMHDRVDGTALRSLHWVLERGFATLPALTVPGGAAWIDGVQRAMAADSAWELPGHPKAVQDAPQGPADDAEAVPPPPRSRSARRRRWGRLAALPLAFAGTFALGLVSGFVLLDSPAPVAAVSPQPSAAPAQQAGAAAPEAAPRTTEAATVAAVAAPAPSTVAAATPRSPAPEAAAPAAPPTAATTAAGAVPAVVPAPASIPTAPAAAPSRAASQPAPPAAAEAPASPPVPVEAPAPAQQAFSVAAGTGAAVPDSPAETRLSHSTPVEQSLPMAPPRAPAPPIRVSAPQQASRPVPVIDRACSQALFRFQQGERLTAAEQNFIRTGCSTARR